MASPTSSRPPAASPAAGAPTEPWIETREGGLFFLNALFFFPYLMLLVPLLTRIWVRGVMGGMPEPSVILDTFPTLAEYILPRMGWLALAPIWLVLRNLALESRLLPRLGLGFLLVMHLAVLVWTVTGWLGIHGGVLPGGPPPGLQPPP